MQGAHQSEPAKTKISGFFPSTEEASASAYVELQSCAKAKTEKKNNSIGATIFKGNFLSIYSKTRSRSPVSSIL